MSGSSSHGLEVLLNQQFPVKHINAALRHYAATIVAFAESDWEETSFKAGKFVEATTKALMGHCGKTITNPRKFSAGVELRNLEHETSQPDSIRLIIPRAAIFVYDIVSNRGGRHDAHDLDANEMDAKAIVPVVSWILAEMTRLSGAGDPTAAMSAIQELSEKSYPFFEEIDGRNYVNIRGLSAPQVCLLLLYKSYPLRLTRQNLIDALIRHGHKRGAAQMAIDRSAQIVDEDTDGLKLRSNGRRQAEELLRGLI